MLLKSVSWHTVLRVVRRCLWLDKLLEDPLIVEIFVIFGCRRRFKASGERAGRAGSGAAGGRSESGAAVDRRGHATRPDPTYGPLVAHLVPAEVSAADAAS